MKEQRISQHPILPIPERKKIEIFWQGHRLSAFEDETIAAALLASNIHIFGYHPKDHSPQGINCANGQCSQCMVLVNGIPVKSCMELASHGQHIEPLLGLPPVIPTSSHPQLTPIRTIDTSVLIIGGGPAGLAAGIELGQLGVQTLLVDDKQRLGGKLVLQTHRFFGSTQAVYAGTRGIDIATCLEQELQNHSSTTTWTQSTAVATFSDHKIGVLRNNSEYIFVKPQALLIATGAREKFLSFPGNTLPGVYGAGAFQTLVNRDLVRPSNTLFIVGGGNVGLIAGYHALQAGINVAGLTEAMPECGGYKVHKDKLVRLGVPIFTSHSIQRANGVNHVESITIVGLDTDFHPMSETEKTFSCDSILVAVGLNPVNEFFLQAKEFGIPAFASGDAEEIAEASSAIYSGRIKGREIAHFLGATCEPIPHEWKVIADILKARPGKMYSEKNSKSTSGVRPIFHCTQEIPCDPCITLCPQGLIKLATSDIRSTPEFDDESDDCIRCEKCIAGCPGLAITLVDYRKDAANPIISMPFEFLPGSIPDEKGVFLLDTEGNQLGQGLVIFSKLNPQNNRTRILRIQVKAEYAVQVAGIRIQQPAEPLPPCPDEKLKRGDSIVCRCERVTEGEVRRLIQAGIRDINQIKAVTRAGMGACGGKTCTSLIEHIFCEENIPAEAITSASKRPLYSEVALGILAGVRQDESDE